VDGRDGTTKAIECDRGRHRIQQATASGHLLASMVGSIQRQHNRIRGQGRDDRKRWQSTTREVGAVRRL
jgi:hypothetical protein